MEEINDLEANVSESEKANARITDWLDVQFELIKKKERLADLKRQLKQLNDDDTRITEMKKAVKNDRNQTKVHRKKLAKKENLTENKETENVIDEELEDAEFFIDDEDAEKNEYKSVKISQGTSNRVKVSEGVLYAFQISTYCLRRFSIRFSSAVEHILNSHR